MRPEVGLPEAPLEREDDEAVEAVLAERRLATFLGHAQQVRHVHAIGPARLRRHTVVSRCGGTKGHRDIDETSSQAAGNQKLGFGPV